MNSPSIRGAHDRSSDCPRCHPTTLAQNTKNNEPHTIPLEYKDFRDVFDKAQTNQLPPSRSYDHAIELKLDFVPKNCKVYPLTLKEEEALDTFL